MFINRKIDKKNPHGTKIKAQFVKIPQGISESAFVIINGKKEYVVKKLGLPEVIMEKKSY